jgi:hypothetical protein
MMMTTRLFTRADDELILAQSRGEMPIKELRRKLHVGEIALLRRARELQVQLHVPSAPPRRGKSLPVDNLEPAKILEDRLLQRLHEFHSEGGKR